MNGESGGGAGRADRSTESPASRRACAARAQPPADSGMRVEGVHNHTLGLVQAFRPPALRPPLSRGRGKVTGKFGLWRREPSGGEALEERVRWLFPGGADPGKVSERAVLAALRSAPTCAPPAKLRGLARRGGGVGGGGRDTAGNGSPAAEGGLRRDRCRWFYWRYGEKWSSAAPEPFSKPRHWA